MSCSLHNPFKSCCSKLKTEYSGVVAAVRGGASGYTCTLDTHTFGGRVTKSNGHYEAIGVVSHNE